MRVDAATQLPVADALAEEGRREIASAVSRRRRPAAAADDVDAARAVGARRPVADDVASVTPAVERPTARGIALDRRVLTGMRGAGGGGREGGWEGRTEGRRDGGTDGKREGGREKEGGWESSVIVCFDLRLHGSILSILHAAAAFPPRRLRPPPPPLPPPPPPPPWLTNLHLTSFLVLPQRHDLVTKAVQGGQGPGWQRSVQVWGHVPLDACSRLPPVPRARPQTSPQL